MTIVDADVVVDWQARALAAEHERDGYYVAWMDALKEVQRLRSFIGRLRDKAAEILEGGLKTKVEQTG